LRFGVYLLFGAWDLEFEHFVVNLTFKFWNLSFKPWASYKLPSPSNHFLIFEQAAHVFQTGSNENDARFYLIHSLQKTAA
jgi:hypothetical protein